MLPDEKSRFISELTVLTREGKLSWQHGPLHNSFLLSMEEGPILIYWQRNISGLDALTGYGGTRQAVPSIDRQRDTCILQIGKRDDLSSMLIIDSLQDAGAYRAYLESLFDFIVLYKNQDSYVKLEPFFSQLETIKRKAQP